MYIGVYLGLGGLFILLSLLIFPAIRDKRGKFLIFSITCLSLGLVIFELASNYLYIIEYGSPGSSDFPGDILAHGFLGRFLIILPFLGVISPLLISFLLKRTGDRIN